MLGKTETFQPGCPADHQAAEAQVFARRIGPKVRHAGALVGGDAQRPIEAGPTFGLNLPFQGGLDVPFATRPEFERNALGSTIPEPATDVIPADDQILTVLSATADQDMNMRIVGVPVVDRDPVEFGSEISRDVGHQLAREGTEIAELGSILRRNNKSKMMPVVLAAFGKGTFIRRIRSRIEHPGVRAVARNALTLQIGDVLGQRCRAKAGAVVTDHARLHHCASRGRAERQGERGAPASSRTATGSIHLYRARNRRRHARPSWPPASPGRQRSSDARSYVRGRECGQGEHEGRCRAGS